MKAFAPLFIILFTLSIQSAQTETLVNSVVAKVDDHIITAREVQINYFLEQALKDAKDFEVKLEGEKIKEQTSEALVEWMIFLEAENFLVEAITKEELTKAEAALNKLVRSTPQSSRYWKSLEVTLKEKDEFINRKLKAKKFLDFKRRSSFIMITDKDALLYYQQNRSRFGTTPFDNVKGSIRRFLSREQARQRLKDWLEVLQKKYKVRHFAFEKDSP